jgi:ABC-type transport system involved in multi-copper enzyme maturation permease subunit
MIWHIIRKEILEHLLSLRFTLSLLLAVSLLSASGFLFIDKYKQESDNYWKETNQNLSDLREHTKHLYELVCYKQEVWRKPKPLTLCAEGSEKSLPDWFSFDPFTIDLPDVKSSSNFLLPHFVDIDLVFITSLILSFVALLLTYDSICGEREAGTLRLMLAGSIPRHKILLGKYIGTVSTLGITLLLGLLANLIIVTSSNVPVFGTLDWLKLISIVLLSFLYLSIFVLLGMFVSSRMARSTSSMVILLLVWVGLVIVIPSFGRIISNALRKLPSRAELNGEISQVLSQIKGEDFGPGAGSWNSYNDNPPAAARYYNAQTDARNRIMEEHVNQMIIQADTGRRLTRISPAVIYQRASETVACTGMYRCVNLYQQVKRYQQSFKEYIRSKDTEDPDSLHLLFQFPSEWVAENWGAISKKPVDFDTVPKFQERDPALARSLQGAMWDIGLLALFNLVFFTAAFASFLRYDVR